MTVSESLFGDVAASASGKGCYIVKFDYRRPPNVLATGIATIPTEAIGRWDLALFYKWNFGKNKMETCLLSTMGLAEREGFLKTLNTGAQYLVFKSGELAEMDARHIQPLQITMRFSPPMFDETAILHSMADNPRSQDWLYTNNTFGTWADVILGKIAERVGRVVVWKMVGSDKRLMPKTVETLDFSHHGKVMLATLLAAMGDKPVGPESDSDDDSDIDYE